jgi:hypothetical protein
VQGEDTEKGLGGGTPRENMQGGGASYSPSTSLVLFSVRLRAIVTASR